MQSDGEVDVDAENSLNLVASTSNITTGDPVDHRLSTFSGMSPKVSAMLSVVSRRVSRVVGYMNTAISKDSAASAQERSVNATSFTTEFDHAMLRATPLSTILWNFGAILKSNAGTERTYCLSHPVGKIDMFLSHNWAVKQRAKYEALILEFNLLPSVGVAFICAFGGCAWNTLSAPPTLLCSSPNGSSYRMGVSCQILGLAGFFLALTQWREGICGRSKKSHVFLDKVCIHQTDVDLKAAAIAKLGAFLRHSQQMVVLYNSLYCKKLWTIYELACFMFMHVDEHESLRVLPVELAGVVIKVVAVDGLAFLSYALLSHFASDGSRLQLLILVFLAMLTKLYVSVYVRAWARDLKNDMGELTTFSFARAQCFDERDRVYVGQNICDFMKAAHMAPATASNEEAILKFETFVQSKMPHVIETAVGSAGFPYHLALLLGLPVDFFILDVISAHQPSGGDWRFLSSWLSLGLFLHVVALPLTVRVQVWAGQACPPWKNRVGEWLTTVAISALGTNVFFMAYLVASTSREKALHSSVWAVGFPVGTLILWPCVAALFGCCSAKNRMAGTAFGHHTHKARSLSSSLSSHLSRNVSSSLSRSSSSCHSSQSLQAEVIGQSGPGNSEARQGTA